jgi:hypothetical protein
MAYTPDYTTDDLEPITGDVIGRLGAGVATFSKVIGLGLGIAIAVGAMVWGIRKWRR